MARVTTIQVPTFAVEATVSALLEALPHMEQDEAQKVWEQVRELPYASLSAVISFPCESEEYAKHLVTTINTHSRMHRTVSVMSFTKLGTFYDVEVDGRKAVSCSCPDYVNRSQINPNHICKHMHRVMSRPTSYGL